MLLRGLRFLLLPALLACASDDAIPVSTSYDPLERFPAQATFVWDHAANTLPNDPSIDRKETGALLERVVREGFAARGYRAVAGGAQYRLSYQFVIHTRTGPEGSHAIGSLSLLLLDAASGRRVWTGFGQAEVYVGLSPEEREQRLREAVSRMLINFPPSQRPEA